MTTSIDTIRLNRSEGLGSSDAMRLMHYDWLTLYNEKVGLAEPEDLSGKFNVQLGIHTETFHLEWLAKTEGFTLSRPSERYHHAKHPFMFAHLDGWHVEDDTLIEVKHSNGWSNAREKARFYMPQLQHMLAITDKPFAWFSVIAGNKDPEMVKVDRSEEYITELIEIEASFWWHVTNQVPPEVTPTGTQERVKSKADRVPVDNLVAYDMASNNAWATHAADLLTNEEAAAAYEQAKKELKGLVPADASECTGHGIAIKRDKRGALRFSVLTRSEA